MATTVEAEVIPPSGVARPFNVGIVNRPGFAMFTTGVLVGLVLGFGALYVIKKKL